MSKDSFFKSRMSVSFLLGAIYPAKKARNLTVASFRAKTGWWFKEIGINVQMGITMPTVSF